MDVSWNYKLKEGQRNNPVVYFEIVTLSDFVPHPKESDLMEFFPKKSYRLQTWGRSVDSNGTTIITNDPHWIGVRRGTPLHIDPKYPRYSHHLKVRVDEGIVCRGLAREELVLERGLFYILDTHSPHQVVHKNKSGTWNIAASIDSHEVLDLESVKQDLIKFVSSHTVST